jgi:hypothetical protein
LPNSPTFGPIRRIELRVVEPTNGGSQIRRRCGNGIDGGSAFRPGERCRSLEAADRVAKIVHGIGLQCQGEGPIRSLRTSQDDEACDSAIRNVG